MSTSARAIAMTGADQVVRATASHYGGFSIRETAGAAAVVRVYDHGSAASGTLLDTVRLAANESLSVLYCPGIWAENGIYVDIVSGTVEGSIRIL